MLVVCKCGCDDVCSHIQRESYGTTSSIIHIYAAYTNWWWRLDEVISQKIAAADGHKCAGTEAYVKKWQRADAQATMFTGLLNALISSFRLALATALCCQSKVIPAATSYDKLKSSKGQKLNFKCARLKVAQFCAVVECRRVTDPELCGAEEEVATGAHLLTSCRISNKKGVANGTPSNQGLVYLLLNNEQFFEKKSNKLIKIQPLKH